MSNFLKKMNELTGKSIEDLTVEFGDFVEIVNRQFEGRLEGDELTARSETLFKQKYRAEKSADDSSGAVSIKMYVSGVSDTQDKIAWQRNKAVDVYKINPNKAIMAGRINEYRITENGVIKRFLDRAENKVIESTIEKLSPNAEEYEPNVWIAPVDNEKKGFGGKENKLYGQEMPVYKYSRYVYGVAEVEGSDDVRWTKLMLRGDNSTEDILEVNHTYSFKAINMTQKKSEEYNFIDVDNMEFTAIEWNPFDGDFMEELVSMEFIKGRVYDLGDVEDLLTKVEAEKETNKFSDWNAGILVEADVVRIFPGKDSVSDRLYVDDDSLRWGEDDMQSNVNVWVSGSNTIDFGEYSRVLMTCYPSRSRPPKDSPDGTKGKMQLNGYGLFAFAKYKTRFEPEE